MRYLDKLLGEATNFKKMQDLSKKKRRLSRKAAYREYQADSAAMAGASDKEVDRASDRMWSTTDQRADASNKLYKLKKKAYLKGGGKGDGKPKGKLRLVQHAAYMQLGFLISEIGDAAELDMAAAEKTVRQGDRWYNWLKKNMKNAPNRKVNKAMGKLRQAGERADKDLAQAALSNVRKTSLMNMPGQKLVSVPQKKSKP